MLYRLSYSGAAPDYRPATSIPCPTSGEACTGRGGGAGWTSNGRRAAADGHVRFALGCPGCGGPGGLRGRRGAPGGRRDPAQREQPPGRRGDHRTDHDADNGRCGGLVDDHDRRALFDDHDRRRRARAQGLEGRRRPRPSPRARSASWWPTRRASTAWPPTTRP